MIELIRHFVAQGFVYMVWPERIIKIALGIIFFVIFYWAGVNLFLSVFLSHLINFLINAQSMIILRYFVKDICVTRDKTERFVAFVRKYGRYFAIRESIFFGSISRNEIRQTSDLDVRIFVRTGLNNALQGALFVLICRSWSTFHLFPLDIYMFQDAQYLNRLNSDELGISIINRTSEYAFLDDVITEIKFNGG